MSIPAATYGHTDEQKEREFLEGIAETYGQGVSDESLRVLNERGENRALTADVLAEALYRQNRDAIDSALRLGEHSFTSG